MNIETLQVKRVTGNWDKHKTYIPADGEIVFIEIAVNNISDIFVIGDGTSDLVTLVNGKDRVYYNATYIESMKKDLIDGYPDPAENKMTANIIGRFGEEHKNVDFYGTSGRYARADHTHLLTNDEVHLSIQHNESFSTPRCRRITAGTNVPPTNKYASGDAVSFGDIYIKY